MTSVQVHSTCRLHLLEYGGDICAHKLPKLFRNRHQRYWWQSIVLYSLYNIVLSKQNVEYDKLLPHAVNCGRFCFWHLQKSAFLFVYEISLELLNGFAPNSHGRRVWSLIRTSWRSRSKVKVTRYRKRHFWPFRQPVCGLFGKTSLASSFGN